MQRYFVEPSKIELPLIYIDGDDYHHIVHVMRMKIGTKVYVSNQKTSWIAKIMEITKTLVTLEVETELHEQKELPYSVTIAQGLVRKEKTEEVIDYICELGASKYIPVMMERSIVKVNQEQLAKKNNRYLKIAKEAAEQSHRIKVMEVEMVCTFKELLNLKADYDLCLYAYEQSSADDSLKKLLKDKKYQNVLILVGPEGGISDKEVEMLKQADFLPISLGPRILRTQVAPIYIMSALSYEWEIKE